MRIFARNPSLEDTEKTYLSDDTLVGATSLTVKNTNNFSNGQRILVGEMSRERSELLTIGGAPTTTGLTVGAAKFPHDTDDPVYALKFDKIRIYRSTTGETGVYSLMSGGTIDIDVDNADGKTWFEDANSLSTYWYKVAFYDSVNAVETDKSDAVPAIGYTRSQIGSIVTACAREVADEDFLEMDPETWIENANDISDDLRTRAKRPYRFQKTSKTLDLLANSSTIDLPTDLWKVNYIEAVDTAAVAARVYRPKRVTATQARFDLSVQTLGGDYLTEVALDDEANKLIVVPKSLGARTGAFYLHYYTDFTEFTSFASTVYTKARRAYKLALKRDFYLMKADENAKYFTKSQKYDQMYEVEVAKLQREKSLDAGSQSMGADRKRYIQFGGPRYRQ